MIGPTLSTLALASLLRTARAFTFQHTAPTQCGEWTVEWNGGSAPFFLVLVPTITVETGYIMNMSMPATGSPPYRHTFTLPEPAGLEMVATMYDADGWGSGGATDILTVGDSADTSCLNRDVKADFYFWTTPVTKPSQCGDMAVTWNADAIGPVGLHGIVPGGSAFDVALPSSAVSRRTFNWTVDIAVGTQVILLMSDAGEYGTGGSTAVLTVQDSGDDSCINDDSPHSTAVPPPLATATSTSASASASSIARSSASAVAVTSPSASLHVHSTTPSPSVSHVDVLAGSTGKKSNMGTIIGVAVGASLAAILALILVLCLCRRRKQRAKNRADSEKIDSTMFPDPVIPRRLPTEMGGTDSAGSTPRQSVLRRLTVSRKPSQMHMRVGSRGTLNGFTGDRRDIFGAGGVISGLPNGAAPPSILTNDSARESIEVSPYPYESPPPDFHSLGFGFPSMPTDVKTPIGAAATATGTGSSESAPGTPLSPTFGLRARTPIVPDPFRDPPSPNTTNDAALPAGEKGGSRYTSPVVRQNTLRSHSDLLHLSNISHDRLTQTGALTHAAPPSSQGAVADNVSEHAWLPHSHDPPPQYNVYDRLRAANPDPSEPSSSTRSRASSGRESPASVGH